MTAWSCGSCKPFVVRSQLGGSKMPIVSYEITKPFLCDLIYNGTVASQLMLIIFFSKETRIAEWSHNVQGHPTTIFGK